jgi:hypothetical protein
MIRTTYAEFQTAAIIIPQGNLTSDYEITVNMHVEQLQVKSLLGQCTIVTCIYRCFKE